MASLSNASDKKTYLNIYISPATKELLEKRASLEDRTLSNLCDRVLTWAAKWLVEAQDSQALMTWEACGRQKQRAALARFPSKRVSPELQDQLHAALDVILDRAPTTVAERMAEYLTARAGKFGDEK